MQDQKPTESKIPQFSSIEEAAEFWDTHSLAEFEDELEDVTDEARFIVRRSGPRKALTVRLDQETYEALKRCAAEYHARPSKLIHLWIQERLYADRAKSAKTTP